MTRQTKFSPAIITRVLRLSFAGASLLGFIFGSLIERSNFNILSFLLGLAAVLCTHLSANLMNDYADSKSGADWQDKNFFKFFGGSKLIQEGTLSENFYLGLARIFAFIALICVISLAVNLKSINVVIYYAAILALAWSYSHKPFSFSYRGMGEIIIFMLFGPALVMGGYFLQTGIFPDARSFILSLPFGFFTTAILFANEIPDFREDKKAGKFTWVNFLGQKHSFILYLLLQLCGFASVMLAVRSGYLKTAAVFSFILLIAVIRAAVVLGKFHAQKTKLIESSKLTIAVQAFSGIILILSLVL